MIETEQLIRIVEGALMAAGKPLSLQQLAELFEEEDRPESEQLKEALAQIEQGCQGRGFELRQVSSGYRFQVVQDVAPWVGRLWEEKPQRYSRALLETLALIAYRQPITRGDIEDIRGVAVSTQIIKTLLEREWVRVVGHKDVPGRPAMYATTRKFLDYFNLRNLDELPALADIRDLDSLNGELAFMEEGLAQHDGAPAEETAEAAAIEPADQAVVVEGDHGEVNVAEDAAEEPVVGTDADTLRDDSAVAADEAETFVADEEAFADAGDTFAEDRDIEGSSTRVAEAVDEPAAEDDADAEEEDSTADSEYR